MAYTCRACAEFVELKDFKQSGATDSNISPVEQFITEGEIQMKRYAFPLMLLTLLLTSLACGLGGLNIQNGGVLMNVSITEDQLNSNAIPINTGDLFRGDYNVDLQPGKAVISGNFVRQDGTNVSGSAEVGITAENGALKVQILSLNAEGIDLTDERVQKFQTAIADGLSKAFSEQDLVSVESVEITDQAISLQIKANLKGGI